MKSNKFEIVSPIDSAVYAERSYASDSEIRDAVLSANKAKKDWKKVPLTERITKIRKVIDYFKANVDQMAMEITQQMGRPIAYTPFEIKGGFVERAETMIALAEEALQNIELPEKTGFTRFIKKEPLGVVLVLAPWNYPYLTSVNAIIPAILAGNTVILKHADQTAICAERYQAAFDEADFPEGVFQAIHMNHDQVTEVLHDKMIDYVAFTGSEQGGKAISAAAANSFMPVGLELGGKDPAYVCADAPLHYAIENLVDGAFFNSGQSCCGIERIYVDAKVYDDFIDGFVNLTKKYSVGNPLLPTTTLGPLVRKRNAEEVLKQIEEAEKKGAKKLISEDFFSSQQIPYLNPQVLVNVDHSMRVMQQETFGPCVGIMSVENEQQALALMNDSKYGLTASIWTSDQEKAMRIGEDIDTGTWFMNRCDYLDPELAWTGIRNSGHGVTLSSLGYNHLTRPKSFHLKTIK
ncbi:MAG: aldehyde dehydrogenase family protein [Cyclobacteriaceae bacterium]